jgi:hypothetical protein
VPTFDLPTTDGRGLSSEEFAVDGRPVLLVLGSLTCPITQGAGAGIRDLHNRYGDRVRFVFVSVREAHPGATVGQPGTMDEKLSNAALLKTHHGFNFDVAVDDIDGTFHRSLGPRPSSAYIFDPTGTIVFRGQWSNVTPALHEAIAAVAAGQRPAKSDVRQTLRSMAQMAGHGEVALATAGKGALRDTWKVAAPMAAMIQASRLFGFLPRDRRGVPTLVTMLVVGLLVGVAVAVAV